MKAHRGMGQLFELPQKRGRLPYKKHFSPADFTLLENGIIPRSSDDKWFIFLEQDWLFLHRSTGHCIFKLRLAPDGDGYQVSETWVNDVRLEFNVASRDDQLTILELVIDKTLLKHPVTQKDLCKLGEMFGYK